MKNTETNSAKSAAGDERDKRFLKIGVALYTHVSIVGGEKVPGSAVTPPGVPSAKPKP